MKTCITGLLLMVTCSLGLAQEIRTLDWLHTDHHTFSLTFVDAVYPDSNSLPVYTEIYQPVETATRYSVYLTYPLFEALTREEQRELEPWMHTLSDTVWYTFSVGTERKKPIIDLKVKPFIRKGNTCYKLVSFRWSVQPEVSPASAPIPATALSSLRASDIRVTSSALATGKWRKISVTKSGIYALTYEEIVKMGLNPDKVQIYGYGGKLLGEDFSSTAYYDDLPEVPVWKVTGSDSVFNKGDYMLFYAQGPVSWYRSNNTFLRQFNPYSDKAYYFVGERAVGTRLAETVRNTQTPTHTVTNYTHLELHEEERVSMSESVFGEGSGRELYGEDLLATSSHVFDFSIPDVETTQFASVTVDAAAFNSRTSYARVSVNDNLITTLSFSGIQVGPNNYVSGTSSRRTGSFLPTTGPQQVRIAFESNGTASTPRAFLNYIILSVRRKLRYPGQPFVFRDPQSVAAGAVSRFTIQNADASTLVFDVTDPQTMMLVEGSLVEGSFSFTAPSSTLREYACVRVGSIPKPVFEGNVANQNLHALQPDMVIITPDVFKQQAIRLAQAHQEVDNLSVLVVTPEQVYNEFSSGTPDATAYRRMMKHYYDKAETEVELPDYLLLFGGGLYDNRMKTSTIKGKAKKNWILTYQTTESLDGTSSFTTDDYFGFLDDSEGGNLSTAKLDIGVGRFPVHTEEQAKIAVDKVLRYMKNNTPGPWKNRVLFMADDGDNSLHLEQADDLATTVDYSYSQYMVNRIYVDAYKRETGTTGVRVPDGNRQLNELLDKGLFLLNYTGHSSMTEWAEEKLMTLSHAKTMTNVNLPLWITASCDYARFDTPNESGGEAAFLNPSGGAIGLYSTSRIVYASANFRLHAQLIKEIFNKNSGEAKTLGNIMRRAKSAATLMSDHNKLSFILVGDPALRLSTPEYTASITRVNEHPVSAAIDTFKALQVVTVEGIIVDDEGRPVNDFNGVIHPTLLDASTLVRTLGIGDNKSSAFYEKSRVLLSVKDSVVNGQFCVTFVIPKDIQYLFKQGRINLYAADTENKREANGMYDHFVLGGTESNVTTDTIGPSIRLFLNDSTFKSGDAVNPTPTLIARLYDGSGLNGSSSGVGHDIQLMIDNDPKLVFSLNGHFISDIGSYQSGTVQVNLPELSPGQHVLSLRAWDVHNNSSVETIRFVVIERQSPRLYDLVAIRKPTSFLFRFKHNRPDIPLWVRFEVIDLMGHVCWSESVTMKTGETVSEEMEWNVSGYNGTKAPFGIYICRVLVTDASGGASIITEKLQVVQQ